MFGIQFLERREILFRNVFYGRWSLLFFLFWPIKSIQMERRWIVLCIRLWITRTVFFNFRLEKYLYIWSYFFLFSQVIKNNGSKWRRWIIVIGNLEFNFWKWRVSFVIFLFSFYSTVPECNNCERIQYPSFATFWKQMEGKLALGSCIYRATFIRAFLFDLRTASRSDRVHRTKRFHE